MSALYDMGFVVRVPSWHRMETTVFEEYPGREEAFIAAGHDFEVVEANNGWEGGIIVNPANYTGPMVRVEAADGNGWEWRSYRRQQNEKGLRIKQIRDGVPGPMHGKDIKTVNRTYEPVQNSTVWNVIDAILTDPSINKSLKLNYETGGNLEGGASCFITAYLDFPFYIDGDESAVYPYVFGTWRHDSQGGINFGGTDVRIVCSNTRGAAESQATKAGRMFSVKHTRNVLERLEDIKMALKGIVIEHNEFHGLAKELASITLTQAQRKEFVDRFIPYPDSLLSVEGEASERQVRNIDNARAAVVACFNSRSIPEAHKYTGWGAYNAATEYLDHIRPGRGGSDIASSKNIQSYVKRQVNPNRAKDAVPALIREVAIA